MIKLDILPLYLNIEVYTYKNSNVSMGTFIAHQLAIRKAETLVYVKRYLLQVIYLPLNIYFI